MGEFHRLFKTEFSRNYLNWVRANVKMCVALLQETFSENHELKIRIGNNQFGQVIVEKLRNEKFVNIQKGFSPKYSQNYSQFAIQKVQKI